MLLRILVAVEPSPSRQRINDALLGPGVLISRLRASDSLWERLASTPVDLVVISRALLPDPPCESIRVVLDLPDAPDVLVVEEGSAARDRADLLAAGALTVIDRGLAVDTLRASLAPLLERRRRESTDRLLDTAEDCRLGDFVTKSPAMQRLLPIARRVASADTTLLVLGETGVGKEWIARAIHTEGARGAGPFVAVNCAAIPEGLFESALFGHEEGAFTGANRDHRGYFEIAHGGTLFLDEIADMPQHTQVKLLRALQDRQIQPVGSERTLDLDVRVMAATNRDPLDDSRETALRKDLYYRLAVISFTVPPLRERREDIPALVENHFEIFRIRLRRHLYGISRDAMQTLVEYDWPGNVRELVNVIERAVLLAAGEEIVVADLPESVAGRSPAADLAAETNGVFAEWLEKPLREARQHAVSAFERRYLTELLRSTRGSVRDTAARAGISPRALFDRMRQLGLRKEDFRSADRANETRARGDPA